MNCRQYLPNHYNGSVTLQLILEHWVAADVSASA